MLHYGKVGFERRVYPRFRVELPIIYQHEKDEPKNGLAHNVSQGGLLLTLEDAVTPGDRLRIQMHLTNKKGASIIEGVGRVVWVALPPTTDGVGYQVGFAFEEIGPKDLKTLRAFQAIWLEEGRT